MASFAMRLECLHPALGQSEKADIDKEGRVDQMLFELAQHRQDSLKLTSFLETWREGIQRAMDATSHDIRRLDLEDIAQLQNLLFG
ncbi:hypothetical protein QW131_25680 [Roseibium salinum]|nr:hypothetical protein [Roseibium salinum]